MAVNGLQQVVLYPLGDKMRQALFSKWIKALRSGKYPQGRERLRSGESDSIDGQPTGFCCLGVLADVSGVGQWDGNCYRLPPNDQGGLMPSYGNLSASALIAIDMTKKQQDALVDCNDVLELTFTEIANVLEGEELPEGFNRSLALNADIDVLHSIGAK